MDRTGTVPGAFLSTLNEETGFAKFERSLCIQKYHLENTKVS